MAEAAEPELAELYNRASQVDDLKSSIQHLEKKLSDEVANHRRTTSALRDKETELSLVTEKNIYQKSQLSLLEDKEVRVKAQYEQCVKELHAQIDALQEQCQILKRDNQEKNEALLQSKSLIQDSTKTTNSIVEKLKKSTSEQLKIQNDICEELQSELGQRKAELKELVKKNKSLSKKVNDSEDEVARLRGRIKELDQSTEEQLLASHTFQTQSKENACVIEKLNSTVQQLESSLQRANQAISERDAALETVEAQRIALVKEGRALTERLSEIKAQHIDRERDMNDKSSEYQHLTDRYNLVLSAKKELQNEFALLTAKNNEQLILIKESEFKSRELLERIEALSDDLESTRVSLEDACCQVAQLTAELDSEKRLRGDLDGEVKRLQSKLILLEESEQTRTRERDISIDSHQERINMLTSSLKEAEQEIERKVEQCKSFQHQVTELTFLRQARESEAERAAEGVAQAAKKLEKAKQKLKEERVKNEELADKSSKERDTWVQRVNDLERQVVSHVASREASESAQAAKLEECSKAYISKMEALQQHLTQSAFALKEVNANYENIHRRWLQAIMAHSAGVVAEFEADARFYKAQKEVLFISCALAMGRVREDSAIESRDSALIRAAKFEVMNTASQERIECLQQQLHAQEETLASLGHDTAREIQAAVQERQDLAARANEAKLKHIDAVFRCYIEECTGLERKYKAKHTKFLLKSRLAQMDHVLKQNQDIGDELNSNVQRLEVEVNSLRAEKEELEGHIELTRTHSAMLQDNLTSAEKELRQSIETKERLDSTVGLLQHEVASIANDLISVRGQNAAYVTRIEGLEAELEELRAHDNNILAEQTKTVELLKQHIEMESKSRISLESNLAAEIAQLQAENDLFRKTLGQGGEWEAKYNKSVIENQRLIDSLELEMEKREEETHTRERLEEKLRRSEEERIKSEGSLSTLITTLKEKIRSLEDSAQDSRQAMAAQVVNFENAKDKSHKQLNDALREGERLRMEVQAYKEEILELQSKEVQTKDSSSTLKEGIGNLKSQIENYSRELQEHKEMLESKNTEMLLLKLQIEQHTAEAKLYRQQYDKLKAEMASAHKMGEETRVSKAFQESIKREERLRSEVDNLKGELYRKTWARGESPTRRDERSYAVRRINVTNEAPLQIVSPRSSASNTPQDPVLLHPLPVYPMSPVTLDPMNNLRNAVS